MYIQVINGAPLQSVIYFVVSTAYNVAMIKSRLELFLDVVVYHVGSKHNSTMVKCPPSDIIKNLLEALEVEYTVLDNCPTFSWDVSRCVSLPIDLLLTTDAANDAICRLIYGMTAGQPLPVESQSDFDLLRDMFGRTGYIVERSIVNNRPGNRDMAAKFIGNHVTILN
jgi:hypothetical protein